MLKETGSIFNILLSPLQRSFGEVAGKVHYLTLSGAIGFPLLILCGLEKDSVLGVNIPHHR